MKIYHYTKGISINSIFTSGFIATEMKAGLSNVEHHTDYVWLTEKKTYPKTALPYVRSLPATHLINHLTMRNIFVDLDIVGSAVGGIYRFSFDSSRVGLKKWKFCEERKDKLNSLAWLKMERIANKVGDDIQSFWISTNDLPLENFSLEVFGGGIWHEILHNSRMSNLSIYEADMIAKLKAIGQRTCEYLHLPVIQIRKAA